MLAITLIITMSQLAVTLSQIVDNIGVERARTRNLVANTIAVVIAVILGLIELVAPFFLIDDDSYQTAIVYAWVFSFSTLAIFYTITLITLNSKMKQLKNFENEIRSVRMQFMILLAAFVIHSSY